MRALMTAGLAVSLIAGAAAVPASAFPVDMAPKVSAGDITQVQFGGARRFHPGGGGMHRGGGFRQGGGFRGGYRGGHRGYGVGVGAGIAGLAAGALIGGAIANSQAGYGYGYGYGAPAPVYAEPAPVYVDPGYADAGPAPGGDSEQYCASRYKSYDPNSGTYLGYDGARHPCP